LLLASFVPIVSITGDFITLKHWLTLLCFRCTSSIQKVSWLCYKHSVSLQK
jgi:hypothetical protein